MWKQKVCGLLSCNYGQKALAILPTRFLEEVSLTSVASVLSSLQIPHYAITEDSCCLSSGSGAQSGPVGEQGHSYSSAPLPAKAERPWLKAPRALIMPHSQVYIHASPMKGEGGRW